MSAPIHAVEANFDGLVGPTHNYGGLSYGNVASSSNTAIQPKAGCSTRFAEDEVIT